MARARERTRPVAGGRGEPWADGHKRRLQDRGGVAGRGIVRPDEKSLREAETEVRRRRGARKGYRVTRIEGDGFFGRFEVNSPSGKCYPVEIRSLTELCNFCGCRDYSIGALGTCKHIEAVLTALRRRAGKRAFERAAAAPISIAQILVDREEGPRIRLRLPARVSPALRGLADSFFDAEGFFLGDPVSDLSPLLDRARRLRTLVIYSDVLEFSQTLAGQREAEERRKEVVRQVSETGPRRPGLRVRLYPYQVEGMAFLASRGRALLGDDMGLGKTVQAIAADHLMRERGEVRRTLIVCPASLKHQWASEIHRFTGMEVMVVEGGVPARLAQYRSRAPFTIANYELALRDGLAVAELKPDLLILDEAQRIRNWRTKTAEAIKEITSPFAFVLTGTPLQNRLDDLYSVMQVVDGRILGPLWAYNERFIIREEGRARILGYRNLDELRRRLSPVLLRRAKEDVDLQLPERIESRLGVALTPRQRDLMEENMAAAARLAKIAEKRPLTPKEEERLFMAMQNARMACNAAGLVDKETEGSPKLDEFEELLKDLCLDRGRKVIVFSEWETFQRMAAARADRLGIGYVRLHGAVPTPKRGALIERFREDPRCLVFFSTDAGGLGLNLQFAHTMINLELPWNPAVLEQRIGRIHRHGQKEAALLISLVSENSFEAGLERTLQSKRDLFRAVLDPEATETGVSAPSSCLAAVRAALMEREEQEAADDRMDREEQEAADDRMQPKEPAAADRLDKESDSEKTSSQRSGDSASQDWRLEESERIVDLLGPRLVRVLELPSGRKVALVDRVDAVTVGMAEGLGYTAVEAGAAAAMQALGEDSVFAQARVLFDRGAQAELWESSVRRTHEALARRKLKAAETLVAAGLGAEALEQAHSSMGAALQLLGAGLMPGPGWDGSPGESGMPLPGGPGQDLGSRSAGLPSGLLYEVLVPRGLLTLEDAARISRAEGLARAYAGSAAGVDERLLREVLDDARRILSLAADTPGA